MDEPMETPAQELRLHSICLLILVAIASAVALYFLRPVLLPFILAVFFVSGMLPVLEFIEKRLRAPRLVAVVLAFLLGFAVLALLWLMIWLSISSLVNNRASYEQRFQELTAGIERFLPQPDPDQLTQEQRELDSDEQRRVAFVDTQAERLTQWAPVALMNLFSSGVVVLVFMFFLLLGGRPQKLPDDTIWEEVESGIREYIVTKTSISFVTGTAFGAVLWVFGVPLALIFGLLAFLLNYIPNIGPVIANLLPLPLILLDPTMGPVAMVIVIVLISVVQFVSGNILEPQIMGKSFDLHPVVILLTLMFWGMLWGIIGMVLATPITAAMKVVLDKFEGTSPIARLMEGDISSIDKIIALFGGPPVAKEETVEEPF